MQNVVTHLKHFIHSLKPSYCFSKYANATKLKCSDFNIIEKFTGESLVHRKRICLIISIPYIYFCGKVTCKQKNNLAFNGLHDERMFSSCEVLGLGDFYRE